MRPDDSQAMSLIHEYGLSIRQTINGCRVSRAMHEFVDGNDLNETIAEWVKRFIR